MAGVMRFRNRRPSAAETRHRSRFFAPVSADSRLTYPRSAAAAAAVMRGMDSGPDIVTGVRLIFGADLINCCSLDCYLLAAFVQR